VLISIAFDPVRPAFMYLVIVPRAIQEWINWPYQSGEGPFISQRHTEQIKARRVSLISLYIIWLSEVFKLNRTPRSDG